MANKLRELGGGLFVVNPWVAAVAVVAVAILGYHALLGIQFTRASNQEDSLNNQAGLLSDKVRKARAEGEAVELNLQSQQRRLEELRHWFGYPLSINPMGSVYDKAQQAQVDVVSVVGSDPEEETYEGARYEVRPLVVGVQAETVADIRQFLSLLDETPPAATVSEIHIAGVESSPSAQFELRFHLLRPEAAAQSESIQ